MHDNRSHPLLEQVPLTVSPFVNLPRATTLPYRYKTMPSALPPSIIDTVSSSGGGGGEPSAAAAAAVSGPQPAKSAYVVSASSGSAAHPEDILASCRALREHVARLQADADAELRQFEERIQARELAEKRRVAPGWLDSDERLLVPERRQPDGAEAAVATAGSAANAGSSTTGSDGRVGGRLEGPPSSAFAFPPYDGAPYTTTGGPTDMAAGAAGPEADAATAEALDRAFGVMQLSNK
ncbi:hypothetical protein SPI_03085 [Niveomyces insectorum RCEF 264]|uniref:Uncharacterized protein n=1 Tax=Niveomyces insectorum RCEF 264 TaxID=1081102 RepID=A0A167X238_9HYPO|nr:hypothetical protein SPI_03085 [Niveomyces insectorum RCEF 264]